jgi:AcrR family transcriptional regulator
LDEQNSKIGQRRKAAKTDSRASYQARRQEIVEAAARVFNRLGLSGASLSAVASEMGVDRATLYYYFSSKEQLFDEIVLAVVEENERFARKIAGSSASPVLKLEQIIIAFMHSYASNYPLLFIYIREDLSQVTAKRSSWSEHMRRLNRSIERSVIDIIESGFQDGSLRRVGSARTMAYAILGMLNWSHRWFRPSRSESAAEVGQAFANFALRGLQASDR